MAIAVGKLYSVKASTTFQIGQTARIELKGTVSLIIYGSEEIQTSVANLTPVSEAITADGFYPCDTLPTYIAFIGTADRINVGGYDLTEIGAIE